MSMRSFARSFVAAALVLGASSVSYAQATRTWVSGVGDDANPCSRTAPCKTFAGAISKTADGGYINVLDSGGFGTVTIIKSITIDGEGFHAGILASTGGNGININGSGIKVVLRNLSIESTKTDPGANGIRVLNAAEVHVEKCWINGFSNLAIDFRPAGGGEGYISDTTIVNNAFGGIDVVTGRVMVDRLRAESNDNGVLVTGNAIASVRNSYAAGGTVGFGVAVNPAAVLNLENSLVTHNTYGLFAGAGATLRASDTTVLSNSIGVFDGGGSAFVVSLGGNEVAGNPSPGAFTSTVAKQ